MSKYSVKLHSQNTINFKYDSSRPTVKRVFEETYSDLQKELVVEQVEELLDVPHKRIEDPRDLDVSLRASLSEKEETKFIEDNNKLYDFWKVLKPRLEEWLVLYAEREASNFKHFTIDLEGFSWNDHELDTPDFPDKSYIDVSAV